MSKKRILFVFFDAGSGHRRVTDAISEALLRCKRGQIEIHKLEFFNEIGLKGLSAITRDLYNNFLTNHPLLYRLYYNIGNSPSFIHLLERLLLDKRFWKGIERIIEEWRPDLLALMNPHLSECFYNVVSKRSSPPLVVNVVTDPFSIHSLWISQNAHVNIIFSEEAKKAFLRGGVDPSRIKVFPYPVHPDFDLSSLKREKVIGELGFSEKLLTVLLYVGGYRREVFEKTVLMIINRSLPIQIILVCGKDKDLYNTMEPLEKESPFPVKVFGYVNTMPELMAASDMVICKAGPAMIFEAIQMRRPLILVNYIPGQEKGNVNFVLSHDFGWYLRSPDSIVDILGTITSRMEILAIKENNIRTSGIVNGAPMVAEYLMGLLEDHDPVKTHFPIE